MSEEARTWAKRQEAPCATSKAVLLEIAAMANMDATCWPSVKLLAKILQKSERQIQRSIGRLRDAGLIVADIRHRENGGQSSNLYRLPLTAAYSYAAGNFDDAHVTPPVTPMSPPPGDTHVPPPR